MKNTKQIITVVILIIASIVMSTGWYFSGYEMGCSNTYDEIIEEYISEYRECEYKLDSIYCWFATGKLGESVNSDYYGYMLVIVPNPYDWSYNKYFNGNCFINNKDDALIHKDTCVIKKLFIKANQSMFGVRSEGDTLSMYHMINGDTIGFEEYVW